jgi:hypothetical protein
MPKPSSFNLSLASFLICTLIGGPAQADAIPVGAFGIVSIERPREMSLLQLRGMGGSGDAVLRTDDAGTCLTIPVRFVAGDFGGKSISGHVADTIHLVISSQHVAGMLANGEDVISDMVHVSDQMGPDVDIVIQSGLDASFGFALNPGRSILADIFGVSARRIACPPI